MHIRHADGMRPRVRRRSAYIGHDDEGGVCRWVMLVRLPTSDQSVSSHDG